MNDHKSITLILPVRLDADRHDLLERLRFPLFDSSVQQVEILVVDDGSLGHEAAALRDRCSDLGYRYAATQAFNRTFSIGRARNLGAQLATTPFLMFQDVDLMPGEGFYKDVIGELEVQGMHDFAERFLMFGVIYLSAQGTEAFQACAAHLRRSMFTQYLLDNNQEMIEKFSTGTSVVVVSREYYLACGGMDSDFEGWGFEDLEFTCRMLRRNKRFPLPAEFDRDYRNFNTIQEYRGWKSTYRLFGDITFMKGLCLFHAWHPVYPCSTYMKSRSRNMALFQRKLEAFRKDRVEPPPLPKPERGRSLLFRRNAFVLNQWVAPNWGEIYVVNEHDFEPPDLLDFVCSRNINRVVFHNPFVNEAMEKHYRAVREAGVEYIVCERGALPGSTFFDPNGFNADSRSYEEENWEPSLDDAAMEATLKYVRSLVAGDSTLENQPEKIGAETLRRNLGIHPESKVLFVPLQRPTDTVITRLAGPVETFQNFIDLIRDAVEALDPDWQVVVKRHPLELEDPDLPGVIWAQQGHIHDLLDVADAVLTINSGVGLLALAHEKPVLVAGNAFYHHHGLATLVTNAEEVKSAAMGFRPQPERILRFYHFLISKFYSFGRFTTRDVAWTEGARMTATTDIEYEVLRIPGTSPIHYERREAVEVSEKSILFDRYREQNGAIRRGGPAVSARNPTPERIPSNSNGSGRSDRTVKKLRKLREDPRRFLSDSRFGTLRLLGKVLE